MAISQSGPGRDFFSFARSSSRATLLCARKVAASSRVFVTGRAASSSCSPPLVAGAAATTRIRLVSGSIADGGDGVARDRQWTAWGFCRDRWTIYGAKKVQVARGIGRRARSALCQAVRGLTYMPSLLSFAKLPKMQTPNAKPLNTFFCDFWKIIRMQSPNAKPLEMGN